MKFITLDLAEKMVKSIASFGISMSCIATVGSKETIPLTYTNWGNTAVSFSSEEQPCIYAFKLRNI